MNALNSKHFLSSVFGVLVAAIGVQAQTCALLNKSHPAQFISYERASKSDVYLRLHNNTSCAIIVETDDLAPLRSGAGRFVGLHYLVQDRRRQTSKPAYGWGDSVFTIEMAGGDSVTFAMPVAVVKKQLDVAVPFIYGWEGDRVSAGSIDGDKHLVYFLLDDIPPDALKRD